MADIRRPYVTEYFMIGWSRGFHGSDHFNARIFQTMLGFDAPEKCFGMVIAAVQRCQKKVEKR